MPKLRSNLMKVERHDDWADMFKKLDALSDQDLLKTWDELEGYDPTTYYVEGVITMDSWSQAVYSELERRAIPYEHHIPERMLNNA